MSPIWLSFRKDRGRTHGPEAAWEDDFRAVKGVPDGWEPRIVRDLVLSLVADAEAYLARAPKDVVGRLAVTPEGVPVEVSDTTDASVHLRTATEEPDAMPEFKGMASF